MEAFKTLKSRYIAMPINDIDTDQIIPARFLKITNKLGLGDTLFHDWRYNPDGSVKEDFILNQPAAKDVKILVAGDNFGCGSSREHAPWALMGYGFRAIISSSFADIFRNNALKNGLLPVTVEKSVLERLFEGYEQDRTLELELNLEQQQVILPDKKQIGFEIDEFSKTCLLEGIDQLGYVLKHDKEIAAYEASHSPRVSTIA